ncbi:hypothetical protein AZE42_05941 [Rhizopogon vesiculosus]|uniref:Stress response RCI peptide n=1 Tax=Rhizopogon vesiculosus TaxID=180088 RepID=A0A1J8QVN7_9AGAM|nr:hypothetical protein AZE42_05941 [Rhizopogon vesiculosus]
MSDGTSCVLIFVAIIFPPAAAAFISGCGCDLFVNILLTLLGYLPGFLHALWLIFKRANERERYNTGGYTYTGTRTHAQTRPGYSQSNAYQSSNAPPGTGTYTQATQPEQQSNAYQSGNAPPDYKST